MRPSTLLKLLPLEVVIAVVGFLVAFIAFGTIPFPMHAVHLDCLYGVPGLPDVCVSR